MSRLKRAENLTDVINIFNPKTPLKSRAELKDYYVARENSPLEEMKVLLLESDKNLKLLFTGHKGSGKSTEINKFLSDARVRKKFIGINFSSLDALNPTDMTNLDILLTILGRIIQAIKKSRDLRKNEEIKKIVKDCEHWTKNLEIERIVETKRGRGILGKLNLYFIGVETGMRSDTIVRKSVREKITPSEIMEYIFIFSQQIEQLTGKKLLLVIEDLDKCDEGMIHRIFRDYSATLSDPKLPSTIYSFPINLRYSKDFMVIRNSFASVYELPNMKLRERATKERYSPGFETMLKAITSRMREELMEPDAMETAVEMSGGNMLYLVQIISGAAIQAKKGYFKKGNPRGKEIITTTHVRRVVMDLRRDFQGMLSANDLALVKKYDGVDFSREEEILHLLHNTSLLLYTNNEFWTCAHPIVKELIEKRRNHDP